MKTEENEKKPTNIHRKYSLIKEQFTVDTLIELRKITMMSCDNNTKCIFVRRLLDRSGIKYDGLGPGTNRYCINMTCSTGMVAVKIALDPDGMIDNRREFVYSPELYPDVVKVYECLPDGLVAVLEYVTAFTQTDMTRFDKQIREILGRISNVYMIGDVGINSKNYTNWGIRMVNGKEEPCMLDFAYIYKISYKLFNCTCDGITLVQYDEDFVGLYCPKCKKKYDFFDIRCRVTRKDQEKEIGNIEEKGYVLHQAVEMIPDDPRFMPKSEIKKIKPKKMSEFERIRQLDKLQKQEHRYDDDQLALLKGTQYTQ